MKKIIIPRKDHEVYFIQRPENIKPRMLQSFVIRELDKMHPGFSSSTRIDLQCLLCNGTHWLMVTVMENETLAEYRLLHKNSVFFTNTSIAVHNKDFPNKGITDFDDERIGFDAEKNTPVSVPFVPGTTVASVVAFVDQPAAIKNIPARYGVFARKRIAGHLIVITAGALLILLAPVIFLTGKKEIPKSIPADIYSEPIAELAFLPNAIDILSNTSKDIVDSGGEITMWQYNEDIDPFLVIRTRGISIMNAYSIFDKYEYLKMQDIREVKYSNGEPYLTLVLNANRTEYKYPAVKTVLSRNSVIPIVAGLSHELLKKGVSISSETLPETSGNYLYTATFTAGRSGLADSLELIGSYCGKYSLHIKKMDVSINEGKNMFTVICSLAQCDVQNYDSAPAENDRMNIPAAFGYRDMLPAVAATNTNKSTNIKLHENEPEIPVLGTIRNGQNNMLFYRDTNDGKIKVRGIQ
ncbi:MAG: hypothetical protein FWF29_08300 [Treponema sp.]|nr:hypothetical protein [Treponema sp.]